MSWSFVCPKTTAAMPHELWHVLSTTSIEEQYHGIFWTHKNYILKCTFLFVLHPKIYFPCANSSLLQWRAKYSPATFS